MTDLLSTDAAIFAAIIVATLVAVAALAVAAVRSRMRWRHRRALVVSRRLDGALEDAGARRPDTTRNAVRVARKDPRVAAETLASAARNGVDPDLIAEVAADSGIERFCRRRAEAVDALQREAAVARLGELGLRTAGDVVAAALRDPSARVRVAAARAWTQLRGQAAVADVVDMFATEPPQVRERLAQILVGIGPAVGDAITDEATVAASRSEIDPLLVRVVAQTGTRNRLAYLELASRSIRTDVRVTVAAAAEGPVAAGLLADLAADPVAEVRAAAVSNTSCPLPAVAARIGDPSWLARTAATTALIGRDGGRHVLESAAEDSDGTASDAASDQLRIAEAAESSGGADLADAVQGGR